MSNFRSHDLDISFSGITGSLFLLADMFSRKKVFMTGGTGFLGKWLLRFIDYCNKNLDTGTEITVLSRDPGRFVRKYPEFRDLRDIKYIVGDVREFEVPGKKYDYMIHAATESSESLEREAPEEMYSVIVDGTRRVVELCRNFGIKRLLYVSSGAVYGKQPPDLPALREDFLDSERFVMPGSAYGKGKYNAEKICREASAQYGFETVIARPFAFVGPYLPLDAHFAAGNFIRDVLNHSPIIIKGDGTPFRSYMYSADLALWLLTILVKGENLSAYNVGSGQAVSILELARTVVSCVDYPVDIIARKEPVPGVLAERYVPDITRADRELGLKVNFDLKLSILKTIEWHREMGELNTG